MLSGVVSHKHAAAQLEGADLAVADDAMVAGDAPCISVIDWQVHLATLRSANCPSQVVLLVESGRLSRLWATFSQTWLVPQTERSGKPDAVEGRLGRAGMGRCKAALSLAWRLRILRVCGLRHGHEDESRNGEL